jgi:hypothetical protein
MSKTNTPKPHSISVNGNWAFYDCINKIKIENNDKLRIFWPDKSSESFTVRVLESSTRVSDMGNPWDCPTSKAFIDLQHNGAIIPIRLFEIKEIKAYFENDVSNRKKIK